MTLFFFYTCLFIVFYTYVGYGILICILAKYFPRRLKNKIVDVLPEVTLCIAAYNEEDVIAEKMKNCLDLDYPKEKLKILWVIDGSTDSSEKLLSDYEMVTVLYDRVRRGKAAALNHAMQNIDSPIVVFTDANCLLNNEAIRIIAEEFTHPEVGCVSGEKRIAFQEEDTVSSKGEGVYWKYESLLKKWDSEFYTSVGAAGELFAIRKDLYIKISEDTLLDDFMISMQIAKKGYRIAYSPKAYAVECGSLNIKEEGKRKRRICAGGWQSVWRLKELLNIFTYGKLSFMFISHRVLRWTITPFALFSLLPLSLFFSFYIPDKSLLFILFFFVQVIFYILAFIGYKKREISNPPKVFYIPFYFIFMNINVLLGLNYLKNNTSATWEKSKRK